MRSQALEHCVLGFTVLATLLWLDLVPAAMIREAAMVLLAWATISTLLVAFAGAWVAFARARANARTSPRQGLSRRS